jgi:hypothetical protein
MGLYSNTVGEERLVAYIDARMPEAREGEREGPHERRRRVFGAARMVLDIAETLDENYDQFSDLAPIVAALDRVTPEWIHDARKRFEAVAGALRIIRGTKNGSVDAPNSARG